MAGTYATSLSKNNSGEEEYYRQVEEKKAAAAAEAADAAAAAEGKWTVELKEPPFGRRNLAKNDYVRIKNKSEQNMIITCINAIDGVTINYSLSPESMLFGKVENIDFLRRIMTLKTDDNKYYDFPNRNIIDLRIIETTPEIEKQRVEAEQRLAEENQRRAEEIQRQRVIETKNQDERYSINPWVATKYNNQQKILEKGDMIKIESTKEIQIFGMKINTRYGYMNNYDEDQQISKIFKPRETIETGKVLVADKTLLRLELSNTPGVQYYHDFLYTNKDDFIITIPLSEEQFKLIYRDNVKENPVMTCKLIKNNFDFYNKFHNQEKILPKKINTDGKAYKCNNGNPYEASLYDRMFGKRSSGGGKKSIKIYNKKTKNGTKTKRKKIKKICKNTKNKTKNIKKI